MIPCSNCKHFTTDYQYDGDDEYEVPVCKKKMPLCLQNGLKCENRTTWRKEKLFNEWKDYFEEKVNEQLTCEFCKKIVRISERDTNPQLCTDGKDYLVYFHGLYEEYYKINYCPICGRKLSEVSE